ncbi:uncharacterized protein LOC117168059 [Belonocnema kinseyi]|uniref:uncharacterized protein LOC117168059 n=1 Tax=Belonocnema kinseyi TaxID=2817044 RepID=UPI00143D6819|nr:uncharacterized protein LOC117168059 [Belonocnema kinseyi]
MRIVKNSGLLTLLLFVACAHGYDSGRTFFEPGGKITSHSHSNDGPVGQSSSSSQSGITNGRPYIATRTFGSDADAYASVQPNDFYYNQQSGYGPGNNGYYQGSIPNYPGYNRKYPENIRNYPGNNHNYPRRNLY